MRSTVVAGDHVCNWLNGSITLSALLIAMLAVHGARAQTPPPTARSAVAVGAPQDLPLQPPGQGEPNDSFESASEVMLPVLDAHACIDAAGDVDYYTFTLTHAAPLFAGVKSTVRANTAFTVQLYDDQRRELLRGDDTIEAPRLGPGAYHLAIGSVQKSCYTLTITSDSTTPLP